jgi:hypothetical protein
MKTALLAVLLLSLSVLHPCITSAQPTADLLDCEYKGKWDEPKKFQRASIEKEQIKNCLRANITIKNHHIVFERYRDAWKELKSYPALRIEGGVLHAEKPMRLVDRDQSYVNGIDLGAFHDPESEEGSIRPAIFWQNVFMDSGVHLVG